MYTSKVTRAKGIILKVLRTTIALNIIIIIILHINMNSENISTKNTTGNMISKINSIFNKKKTIQIFILIIVTMFLIILII